MRARTSVILGLLVTGLAGGPAVADDHREGEYGGVTPGVRPAQAGDAPAGKRKRARRPPARDELTWIGFEAKDGGAQLFFQAPAAFTVVQWVEKGQVVIVLEGLRRQVRNTRRPLDTRYFDAPIARVTARPVGARGRGAGAHKAGIEVRVAFKNPKDAHEAALRTATEADGMFYAYVGFGGGTTDKPSDAGAPSNAPDDKPDAADGQ